MTFSPAPAATASLRRYMRDQAGMLLVAAAVAGLAGDSLPSEGCHRGDYHRLRAAFTGSCTR